MTNIINWSGRTLALARSAFPEGIDLVDVRLESRSGKSPGDPGFTRKMGRQTRSKVRQLLINSGLVEFDQGRLLKAKPPLAGMTRTTWIANAYRDVRTALSDPGAQP